MKTSILKNCICIVALLFISTTANAQPGNITFTPLSAKPGDLVTIVGVNFAGTVALTDVFFGNTKVTAYTSASTTTLRVTVPIGATYGPITVLDKLNKRYGTSRQYFSPIFSKPKGSFDANDMTVSGLFSTGTNPYNVAVGDVDGDGKPDAVAVNYGANTVSVLRNTSTAGNINFATKLDFATGINPYSVALADIDNDTKLDIIVVNNGSSTISVLKNTSTIGAISFAVKVDKPTGLSGSGSTGIAVADIDSDGWQDVLVCNGGNNKVSFLQNTSSATAINFATRIEYTTGTTPRGIAIGDIDGDGRLDIITTNAGASSVSVIRNTTTISGSLTVATKVDYTVGLDPVSVALGDITADGKLDVVVSNYSATNISTLRNNSVSGTITLIAAVNKSAIPYPETIAIADIDADGKVDVMFASNASSFAVLKNTTTATTPTYAASIDFGTGSLTYAHAMGDIDGDGKIDAVVVTNYNNAIVVVRNAPVYSTNANLSALTTTAGTISPTFSSSTTSYTASVPMATTSITVTPTKQQDSAKLEIQLNGGAYTSIASGSPSAALTLNLGVNTINIRVTAQDGTTIKIYTLTVNRAAPPTITSISPTSGVVGKTVTITGTFFSSTPANNVVFFGAAKADVTAATTTSLTVTVPIGATYAPITILNTASVLAASSKQYFNTTYKPNKGSISNIDMTASANFTVNSDPQQVAIGDIDGDGKVDVVVVDYGNSKVSVLRNTSTTGTVSFATKVDFTTTTRPYSVALADINNDGKLDIITADFLSATISVFRNTSISGTVSFATRVDKSSGIALATHQFLAVADIDGDGKLDVAVANGGTNDISVLRNTSTTTIISFATFITFSTVNGPSGIAVGDIDNDGKPDVVVSGETNLINGKISILRNTSANGTINFATKVDYAVAGGCSYVSLGDVNGDGFNDIVTGNTSSNNITVLVNYSVAPTFSMSPLNFSTGTNGSIVSIADIDGDGKLDIAVAGNAGGGVIVLRNTTTATWATSFAPYIVFASAPSSKGVACADIDGDGKVDITAVSLYSPNLVVLRNAPVLSSNNNLTTMSATAGALSPVFDSLTTSYNINVRNYVTTTTVTATKKQDSANIEMQFNGGGYTAFVSGSTSSSLSLNIGVNTINFKVTAQNGNIKIYTITITRACLAAPSTTNLAVCPSQLPYTWNTLVFSGAGTQGIILTTPNGCDSLATLVLTVKANSTSTTTLTACDSLVWNGTTYKSSGTYTYHTLNSIGCDSAAKLIVTIKKPTTSWTDVITCDSTKWNGVWYSKSGFYIVHFTNKAGCDSAAALNLTVNDKPTGSFSATNGAICVGDSSYISFDVPFTKNRQYLRIYAPIDTTFEIGTASFGADTRSTPISANSISYLPNSSPSNQACSTTFATNLFDGKVVLIDRGNCTFTSKAKAVQDAGAIGIIIVNNIAGDGANGMSGTDPTITIPVISVSLEDGQIIKNWLNAGMNVVPYSVVHTPTYLWSTGSTSNTIKAKPTQTTIYNVTVSYENGCSQKFYYALLVRNNSTSTTNITTCDSTVWNGVTYKTSGQYVYHTLNNVGCDSAATLNLTIKKSTSSWTDILACDSAFYNGTIYKTSGQYIFHTINAAGCDSTSVLNVTLKKSTSSTTTLSVCDSIIWNGIKYKQSGIYTFKTNNAIGCDSVATLSLTIKAKTASTTNLSICPSALPYAWNGLTFTAAGSKTKTGLVNSQGCDSSATLNLSIKTATSSTTDTTICSNLLPFIWNGATFISSATFNKSGFINSQGCDSTAILNLTVKTAAASTTNLSICPSQLPYSWNGLTFTAAGTKTKTGLINSQGCDSSVTLNLTIKPLPNAGIISGTNNFCRSIGSTTLTSNGEAGGIWSSNNSARVTVTSAGKVTATLGGNYIIYYTVNNTCGTDTACFNITVNVPSSETITTSACASYTWGGTTYTTSGTYIKTGLINKYGCDSSATLNLTIKTTTSSTTNLSICPSQLPYIWNGLTFTAAGSKTKTGFTNSQGCDSSATLNLIVSATPLTNALNFSGCQQVIYKGKTYLSSSTFIDTAKNSLGCDSIYYTVYITVRNTTPTTQTQNLVGCKKIIFNGKTYVTSSIVRDTVRTNFNCDSIYKITNITINTNCVYYINTTFTVSMTNYLRTGNTIDTGGIRIAGNFTDLGINLPNWTPTSPLCKLTRISSSDDWSISIPIPDTSINKTLLFKFVNTNWGKNEGIDFGSELRISTLCSVTDGGGNYNRFLVLPTNDSSVHYCWERCSLCNTTENAPTVATGTITATTPNKVTVSNNNLIATGGLTVTHKGLLVSTHPNPNIYNNSFNSYFHYINPSLGTYSVFIGGLYSNTQYYARAYASNAIGTTYGSIIPFVLCDTAKRDTLNLTGCGNIIYNGNTYTSSTIKKDTLKTTLGCDSIYRVANITVKTTSASYHSATVCANALPYTWNGSTYNTAGNYTVHYTNAVGCDSTVYFKLIINAVPVISLNSSSNCLNIANLNLTGASNALQIVWQNNGSTVHTTMPTVAAFGTTVAGGNPTSTLPNALNGPSSVFVDKNGVLYVGDLNNARIQRFAVGNLNATTVAGSGTIGVGLHQFNSPSGVMVNDSNNVYVGDFGNHRVTKWLPNATSGIVVAGGNGSTNTSNAFNGVADIFVDAANNIYVADQNNHRIQKWTPGATSGVTVAGGNGAGSNANQINLPTAVFVDAVGNVYVGDYGNKRVTKWTVGATNGITVAGGNGAGAANNQIDLLAGLFVDAIGNVYVADQNNHRIQRWAVGATTGVTVAGGNGAGSNANQFKYPKDVFIDTMGALYVPDNWNQRVQKFTSSINSNYLPTTLGNYTAIVTNNAGCTATSNVVSIASNATPTIGISATQTNVCAATKVRFNATINNGGSNPVYQWKRNGFIVGNNSNSYLDSSFHAIDSVWCVLTSNATCITNPDAKSNVIQLLATQAPTQQNINLQGCSSVIYNGNSYFNSTTVNDTLKTVDGCDSIFKQVNINITNPSTPTNSITSNLNNICFGTKIIFTATAANQGTSPIFKWYKNGVIVSTNSNLYQDSLLKNQDSIWCILTSSDTCITANNIKSNVIKMNVSLAIAGSIKTPIGNFVANVVLNRTGTKNDAQIVSKKYNSSCIDYSNNINLRPTKNNDITKANGINATDVLFTQRHILNTSKLNSAYKLIAADVNGDKLINATDVLRIKRLILGTDTTFTKGSGATKLDRLWEFVDSAYQFPDTTNPFPFKDSISFTNLTSSKTNQSFIGVKLGDVNYDWNPAIAKGVEVKPIELVYHVISTKEKPNQTDFSGTNLRNDKLRIPITVKNFKELVAMQYSLHFNNNNYEFVGIENNKLGIDFNSKQANTNGNIAMLWTDKNAIERTLEDGTELFVLVLQSTVDRRPSTDLQLTIDNSITDIAAWDKDLGQHNIMLAKQELITNNSPLTISQWSVSPNPTSGEIKVSIVSKTNKTVSFELTDAQGKAIVKQVAELQKGNNSFTMNLKKNGNITPGIYFLTAVGVEGENVQRVMVK